MFRTFIRYLIGSTLSEHGGTERRGRAAEEDERHAGTGDQGERTVEAGRARSIVGALCYCELATAYPSAGGDYSILKTTYGRSTAFLFAWARFAVINTGSIALLGFVSTIALAKFLMRGEVIE